MAQIANKWVIKDPHLKDFIDSVLRVLNGGIDKENFVFYRDSDGNKVFKFDQGNYSFQAKNFISDVATGTQPYACTSETLNTHLNADFWDGYQFADYLDQAVKVASSPTFANILDSGYFKVGGTTGVNFTAVNGVLTIAGLKSAGNNENLTFDFETTPNTVGIGSGTGVTNIDWGTLNHLAGRVLLGGVNTTDWDVSGDCVGQWKLNDSAADTVVADSSGNGNTGTLVGGDTTATKSVAGKINNAFDFNGTDDYVDCGDSTDYNFSTKLSVFCWINADNLIDYKGLVGKYEGTGNKREWGMCPTSSDTATSKLSIYFGDPNDGTFEGQYQTTSRLLTEGSWIFVGFTYNAGTCITYINGVAVAGSLVSGAVPVTLYNNTAPLKIGMFNGDYFDGKIDNVKVFNDVLTSGEVWALYNSGTGTELLLDTYDIQAIGTTSNLLPDYITNDLKNLYIEGEIEVKGNSFFEDVNISGLLHLEAPAVTAYREFLFKGSVSDSGNDAFYIANGSALDLTFLPVFSGYLTSLNTRPSLGFYGLVPAANDASSSSNYGIVHFLAGRTDSATDPLNGNITSIVNRKLFTFAGGLNETTDIKMCILADGTIQEGNIYPLADDTYYLGKNDDDTPFAWKGVILKDTTNGKYYRVEVISGTITATDLTD